MIFAYTFPLLSIIERGGLFGPEVIPFPLTLESVTTVGIALETAATETVDGATLALVG